MSKSPFNGVWTKLNAFRPGLIRLLACDRQKGRAQKALSDEEIASRCSLSVSDIQRIEWELSWDNVTYLEMKEFFKGCGFDLNKSEDIQFIARRLSSKSFKWRHLQVSPHHRFFHKLLKHNLGS